MIRLELKGAVTRLEGRDVLSQVTFQVRAGEAVALCGPNGAGKSSVIRAALGLLPLSAGEIRLGGDAIHRLSPRQRAERAAYLPQDRRVAWNMPAVEIAALGAPFLAAGDAKLRARDALAQVGLAELADRGVAALSGGERSRVLLARALVAQSDALLADEPVSGLDPDARLLVLDRLKERARGGQAVVASLHDLTLAARWADRVVVLSQGRVAAHGPPMQALSPAILRTVFGVHGTWIDTPSGPLLDVSRVPDAVQGA